MVPDDETFRKMAQSLIFNEFGTCELPDAPGRDYQIDAVTRTASCVGTVFSFKRYTNYKDLKKQLGIDANHIVNYRESPTEEVPGQLWAGVTNLEVWTNLPLSPQQMLEIRSIFKATGLIVEARNGAYIEQLLNKYPSVKHLFGKAHRALLLERTEFIASLSDTFQSYYESDTPLLERTVALDQLRDALVQNKAPFLVIQAAGGLGKTRLLLELPGYVPERKFFFIDPTVKNLADHRDELVFATGAVLLIDEPQDALHLLDELLRFYKSTNQVNRSTQIIVAIRPSSEEALQRTLASSTGAEAPPAILLEPLRNTERLTES